MKSQTKRFVLWKVLFLGVLIVNFSACEMAVLNPAEDATVYNSDPNGAFCNTECLEVYQINAVGVGDLVARSYLVFNLLDPSIDPPVGTVSLASIKLSHCQVCSLNGNAVIRVYEVTEPWDCLGATAPPISWSWQPSHALTPVMEGTCEDGDSVEIYLKDLVQKWVDNPASNFGLVLTVNESSTVNQEFSFLSVESSTADTRPKLIIRYE
jgi:hypothetical protein